jgi:myo-inositol 2-dehydrogenase/D-chiro-inositol 1-dehydrogenase
VVLRAANGVLIDVEVFVNARYGYEVRCELVGETGTATLPDPTPLVIRRDGERRVPIAGDWRERFADAYRIELQDWVDGATSGPSAWDGYAATAVAQAGVESLRTGATTAVELAPRPPMYGTRVVPGS